MTISGTLETAPPHFSAVEMTTSADYRDKAPMEKLIAVAERGCIVANTLKDAVKLTIRLA